MSNFDSRNYPKPKPGYKAYKVFRSDLVVEADSGIKFVFEESRSKPVQVMLPETILDWFKVQTAELNQPLAETIRQYLIAGIQKLGGIGGV